MLEREQAGEPYVKAEVNRRLRSGLLSKRNRQSIEFRMCNISSVLHEAGRPYIAGYKPRSNVGTRKSAEIAEALSKASAVEPIAIIATTDQRELDSQVAVLLRNPDLPKPEGDATPQLDEVTRKEHKRNADVKAWVLQQLSRFPVFSTGRLYSFSFFCSLAMAGYTMRDHRMTSRIFYRRASKKASKDVRQKASEIATLSTY